MALHSLLAALRSVVRTIKLNNLLLFCNYTFGRLDPVKCELNPREGRQGAKRGPSTCGGGDKQSSRGHSWAPDGHTAGGGMAPRLRAGIMLPDCHVTNCHNLFFKIRLQASEEERETPRVRGSERLELNCQRWKYACLVTSVETAYSSD